MQPLNKVKATHHGPLPLFMPVASIMCYINEGIVLVVPQLILERGIGMVV